MASSHVMGCICKKSTQETSSPFFLWMSEFHGIWRKNADRKRQFENSATVVLLGLLEKKVGF